MNSYNGYSQSYNYTDSDTRGSRDLVLRLVQQLNPGFEVPRGEDFDTEELQGSFQQLMSDNLGAYATVDFIVGTSGLTTREGFLVGVGRSYILLYDFGTRSFTMCDAFSIKFVNFPYLDAQTLRRHIPRELAAALDKR